MAPRKTYDDRKQIQLENELTPANPPRASLEECVTLVRRFVGRELSADEVAFRDRRFSQSRPWTARAVADSILEGNLS